MQLPNLMLQVAYLLGQLLDQLLQLSLGLGSFCADRRITSGREES